MIAMNQTRAVSHVLFENRGIADSLHLGTVLAKPLGVRNTQSEESWENDDEIEELDITYGVLLAIRNKNTDIVRLLIDGNDKTGAHRIAQIWNIGHILTFLSFLSFLSKIVKVEWHEGVTLLLGLKRVKQLFSCITDTDSFLDVVYELIDILCDNSDTQ